MAKPKRTSRKPKPFTIPKEQAKLMLLAIREDMLEQMALEELAELMLCVKDKEYFLFHQLPAHNALEILSSTRAERISLERKLNGEVKKNVV